MGEANFVSIAAVCDNTGYACLGEANGMSFGGWNVNFVARVEESDGWNLEHRFMESVVI
jgi:hypothetical protein